MLWLNQIESAIASKRETVRQTARKEKKHQQGSSLRVAIPGGLDDSNMSKLSKKQKSRRTLDAQSSKDTRNG